MEESVGYYSGKEFENLKSDLNRSYCSSVQDLMDKDMVDTDHQFQPFDFVTSRKTKRFFKEDFVNLTHAALKKDYVQRAFNREISTTVPLI